MLTAESKSLIAIITGAGASAELNFPLGRDLLGHVRKLLDVRWNTLGEFEGDERARDLFLPIAGSNCFGLTQPNYLAAAEFIRQRSLAVQSIDDFLSLHRSLADVQAVGKIAIAQSILSYERGGGALRVERPPRGEHMTVSPQQTWLTQMWSFVCKSLGGVDLSKFSNGNFPLKIITFNYDRSIELFIYFMAMQTLSLSPERALQFLSGIEIIHVYGSVGGVQPGGERLILRPDWGNDNFLTAQNISNYRGQIEEICSHIITYTEGVHAGQVAHIKELLAGSSQIYFCGLGYHRQNMDVLIPGVSLIGCEVYGTAFGLSSQKVSHIAQQLESQGCRNEIIETSWKASDMFKAVGHRLDDALSKALTA